MRSNVRSVRAVALAIALVLVAASPVAAQGKSGTKVCTNTTGWVAATWYDDIVGRAPGGNTFAHAPLDHKWHATDDSGAYGGGAWWVSAAALDLPATYAYCRGT